MECRSSLAPGLGTNDIVDGGDGSDIVDYRGRPAVDVNFEAGVFNGGASGITLKSIENVYGSYNDDVLLIGDGGEANGFDGDDTLSGSTVAGALTTEVLRGGDGADKFLIHANTGMDVIEDFTPTSFLVAGDKLIFAATEFGGIAHEPGFFGDSTAVRNVAGGGPIAANRASPQFIFDQLTSILYFDADGTGASEGPVPVALLNGVHTALTNGGFLGIDEFEIV